MRSEAPANSGATTPRWRDCPANVRELRAQCGLHTFDRALHSFWGRLPLRELRVAATVAAVGVTAYFVVIRRGSIEHALSTLGHAQPGWITVAVAAELASLACYV